MVGGPDRCRRPLTALFAPTFSEAVLNQVFWWSLALVLFVWLIQFLVWALPKPAPGIPPAQLRGGHGSAMAAAAANAPAAVPRPLRPGGKLAICHGAQ